MAKARTFTIRIVGDAKQAQKALQGVGTSAKGLTGSLAPATASLGKLFGAAISFVAIGRAVRGLGSLAYAASDLGEVQSKVNQIFGDSARQLDEWSRGSAKAFGQARTEAMNAASTFGVFGKSAGLTGTELINFSTDLTELAADMASFNNTTIDEAILALGSGLRGENEPLRRFGILLDDATLRMEALKLGLISNTKQALTPQKKVLAATSAIYAQTSDQQGDFARTADGAANQTRILIAQFKDMKTEIGQALLPVLSALLGYVTDLLDVFREDGLGGAIKKVADDFLTFTSNAGAASKIVSGLLGILAGAAVAWGIYAAATTAAAVATMGLSAAIASIPIIGQIAVIVGLIIGALTALALNSQTARDIMKEVWTAIVTIVESGLNDVLWVFNTLVNGVVTVINALISAYNAIPFAPNIGYLEDINFQLDLNSAKFHDAARGADDYYASMMRIRSSSKYSPFGQMVADWKANAEAAAKAKEENSDFSKSLRGIGSAAPAISASQAAVDRYLKAMQRGAERKAAADKKAAEEKAAADKKAAEEKARAIEEAKRKELEAARKIRQAWRDVRLEVKQNITGLLSLGDAFQTSKTQPGGMMKAFKTQAAEILGYAKNLGILQSRGLGQAALNQIMSLDLMTGASIAHQLVAAGMKPIRTINRTFRQISEAGAALGTQFANAVVPNGAPVTNNNVTNNMNITVTNPDPNAVVKALRQYQRQNGSVPIKVSV